MGILNRDAILGVKDITKEKVHVESWGGDVYVQGMSGTERDAFESSILGKDGKMTTENIRAKLLVRTIVDKEGNRIFSDGDIEVLGKKSAKAIDLLFEKSQKLNRLSDEDIEDLAKN